MRLLPTCIATAAISTAFFATPSSARADLVGGGQPELASECKLTPERPYPVVLVHGQAGDVRGMTGVIDRLRGEGYCVFGKNYGSYVAGFNGQAHLWQSGAEVGAFIDWVLDRTKAQKVDVVGHSAGTGVLDNYILAKGGASKVHSFVSFGGLHHPYWHLGLAGFADIDIHLPNLIKFGQTFFPGITVDKITDIIAGIVGDPALQATINSPFVEDLFDEGYWNQIHGGPSEPPGIFVKILTQGRTIPTRDSVPGVCNTNIVAVGDMLVGQSTGYLDPNPNVDNFLTTSVITGNSHNDMLGNVDSLNKMMEGIRRNCGNGGAGGLSVSPLSGGLGTLDNGAPVESPQALEARRLQRQKDFAKVFLNAVNDKYGTQLERSDRSFPPGVGGVPDDAPDESGDDGSSANASSCAVGTAPEGRSGWSIAGIVSALGLVFAARARARRSSKIEG